MKYTFGLEFLDGKLYEQSSDDKSLIDPNRSSYFDVLAEEAKGNPPVKFCMVGEGCSYLVDLWDGHFSFGVGEEEGAKFWLYKPLEERLKLIYYRDVSVSFAVGANEENKFVVFNFGWQQPGTDIKRIISLR